MISIGRYLSHYDVSTAYKDILPLLPYRMVNFCGGYESNGCIHRFSLHDLDLSSTNKGSNSNMQYDISLLFSYHTVLKYMNICMTGCHYLNLQ